LKKLWGFFRLHDFAHAAEKRFGYCSPKDILKNLPARQFIHHLIQIPDFLH